MDAVTIAYQVVSDDILKIPVCSSLIFLQKKKAEEYRKEMEIKHKMKLMCQEVKILNYPEYN